MTGPLEHRKTELAKLEQGRKLEELRIQSELAQNQAKLNVCMSAEKEGLLDDRDLDSIPQLIRIRTWINSLMRFQLQVRVISLRVSKNLSILQLS